MLSRSLLYRVARNPAAGALKKLFAFRDPADPLRGLEAKLLSCLVAQCLPWSEKKCLEVENELPDAENEVPDADIELPDAPSC